MIPSSSLFSHLPCGFGNQCDRPYCLYYHPGSSNKPIQKSASNSYQVRNSDYKMPSTSLNIVQEEETDPYNNFAYHAYIDQSNQPSNFPTYEPFSFTNPTNDYQEDMGQFIPVNAEYTPTPIAKVPEKRKHYEYSVLDDKPKMPVDLGNDEILLGLSGAHKDPPPKKKSKQEFIVNKVKKVPVKSSTINQNKPVKTLNKEEVNSDKLASDSRKPSSSKVQSDESIPQTSTKIDAEQEMREIELLERKTRLLKEYKKLAEEISQIESKKAAYSDPKFVDSLFEDDEPPSTSNYGPPVAKIVKPVPAIISKPIDPAKRIANTVPIRKPIDQIRKMPVIAPSKNGPIKASIQQSRTIPSTSTMAKTSTHTQMLNRFSNNSSIKSNLNKPKEEPTKAASLSKNNNGRIAHKTQTQTLELVPLDRYATKIPFSTRMRSLKKLHEEFCKHSEIQPDQAVEMSQTEEKLLFDRSQTATGYASSLAGAVRGIRNKQFTIPTVNSQGQLNKAPSITEIMEKERKASGRQMTEEQFYQILREKYILSNEQMQSNGYPYIVKGEDGRKGVKIDCADERKLFSEDNDLSRLCCRCGTVYTLKPDGSFISEQDCIFHWKRAFKRRINRTMESRYGCCDSDLTVKGCAIFSKHVHQTMRRSVLKEFIRTPPPDGPNDMRSKRVYAMDCEMVYSTWGMSLARVSIVDWNDDLVLDMIIKPTEEVLDCNTKFSGLTMEMLEKAEYDLNKARKKMFEFVNSETILIGHSLESDLKSLRLIHRRIVDTSVVYPHRLGPPMKRALRNLASDYLQKIIQEDVEGHDSKEDSTVCMQLMIQKVKSDINL